MNLFLARIKDFVGSIVRFFTKGLWTLDFSELGKIKRRWAKYLQAIILSAKGFTNERIGREAIALSRFSTLAVVPMLAVMLFIASGFGLDKMLADMLHSSFPTSNQLIDVILGWADNIVKATEKGAFGWISAGAFLWTILWLMINVGIAFNRIWQVKKPRKAWKRIVVFFTAILLSPFMLLLFLSGWAYYARFIGILEGHLGAFSFITTNLFWVMVYVVVAIALSLMYKFIPHTKVRYGAALRASFTSGLVFVLLQYLYLGTQMMVTRMSAVYGALAFIPLFMIWMNLCWQIILFGAELSRAFDQLDSWEEAERSLSKYEMIEQDVNDEEALKRWYEEHHKNDNEDKFDEI
jgi:Predicted membrane protein